MKFQIFAPLMFPYTHYQMTLSRFTADGNTLFTVGISEDGDIHSNEYRTGHWIDNATIYHSRLEYLSK